MFVLPSSYPELRLKHNWSEQDFSFPPTLTCVCFRWEMKWVFAVSTALNKTRGRKGKHKFDWKSPFWKLFLDSISSLRPSLVFYDTCEARTTIFWHRTERKSSPVFLSLCLLTKVLCPCQPSLLLHSFLLLSCSRLLSTFVYLCLPCSLRF